MTQHLFCVFKTAVSADLSLSTMPMDGYIKQAPVTCVAIAVGQEPPLAFAGPELLQPALRETIFNIENEPHAVFAHNTGFHRKVWEKLGWPTPSEWCCTMSVMKRMKEDHPKLTKFSLAEVAKYLMLPERIKVDEMSLGGKCTGELLTAAKRDVALSRAIAEHILKLPRTPIK